MNERAFQYLKSKGHWYFWTSLIALLPLLTFMLADYEFKHYSQIKLSWELEKIPPQDGKFAALWFWFVGSTIALSLLGTFSTSIVVKRLLQLEWQRGLFVVAWVLAATVFVGYPPAEDSQAVDLFKIVGNDLFSKALSNQMILVPEQDAFKTFQAIYHGFTFYAALLSVINILGFAVCVPNRADSEHTADISLPISNLNSCSMIVTIGVLQLFAWLRLPSSSLTSADLISYQGITRSIVLFYSVVYVLIIAIAYWLTVHSFPEKESERVLRATMKVMDWSAIKSLAAPIVAALAATSIDVLIKN